MEKPIFKIHSKEVLEEKGLELGEFYFLYNAYIYKDQIENVFNISKTPYTTITAKHPETGKTVKAFLSPIYYKDLKDEKPRYKTLSRAEMVEKGYISPNQSVPISWLDSSHVIMDKYIYPSHIFIDSPDTLHIKIPGKVDDIFNKKYFKRVDEISEEEKYNRFLTLDKMISNGLKLDSNNERPLNWNSKGKMDYLFASIPYNSLSVVDVYEQGKVIKHENVLKSKERVKFVPSKRKKKRFSRESVKEVTTKLKRK